jgi:prepilin-type N-terminal cleavage/methylation domain-containing protein
MCNTRDAGPQSGFTLIEFLISALILLITSAAVFSVLAEIQRTASYQAEVQTVLNNTRIAMETIERTLRQAGNNPFGGGLSRLTIISASEVRVESDITGSGGTGNPDKGDPDGDTDDSGERVTLRYNSSSRAFELVPDGSSAQIVAGSISGLSFQFYDGCGNTTASGNSVQRISVSISGTSLLRNPQTHKCFGITLNSDIRILT